MLILGMDQHGHCYLVSRHKIVADLKRIMKTDKVVKLSVYSNKKTIVGYLVKRHAILFWKIKDLEFLT